MTPHLITAIAVGVLAAAATAFALFATGGGEARTVAGRTPAAGDLQVVGAESALRPLRPELAVADHGTPFAMAHVGASRGTRIPLPPPPPVAVPPLPVLPLPER